MTDAQETLFDSTLLSLPAAGATGYGTDPLQAPTILASGIFAQSISVGVFEAGTYGALAASAINSLWVEDGVFILQISDTAYGQGAGAACAAYPDRTSCINGVAYIWLRWSYHPAVADKGGGYAARLDTDTWNVWGAYGEGSGNANHLVDFGLDLPTLTNSAIKTWGLANGFPFLDQDSATISQIQDNPSDLNQADLIFFTVPICNIDYIIGPDKHLSDLATYGGCTCSMQSYPNSLNETWRNDLPTYAAFPGGYVGDGCTAGWVNN